MAPDPRELIESLQWIALPATIAVVGYAAYRYVAARRDGPAIDAGDAVYRESFASGRSERNRLMKYFGGANNCLRLIVTPRYLRVTAWFPFSLITPMWDLEHVIPISSIVSVEQQRTAWVSSLLVRYRDANGEDRALRLVPKRTQAFLDALAASPEYRPIR